MPPSSIGFTDYPLPPMPAYTIPESICRYCARLRFGVYDEFPHPRLWMECVYAEPYAPIRSLSCEHFMREIGADDALEPGCPDD